MWLVLVIGPPLLEALGLAPGRLLMHAGCVLVSLCGVLGCRWLYRRLVPSWLPRP